MTQPSIWSQILVFDVRVDRHFSYFTSTDGADEVNRHRATLFLQDLAGVVGDLDLHTPILKQ